MNPPLLMEIFHYCKMQGECLLILFYLGFLYFYLGKGHKSSHYFNILFIAAQFEIFFDGLTAWSVNRLDIIPLWMNRLFHCLFFQSLLLVMLALLLYFLDITSCKPQKKWKQYVFFIPLAVSSIFITAYIPQLDFILGNRTNYSHGTSVYICFITAAALIIHTLFILFSRYRYIEKLKRIGIFTCVIAASILPLFQLLFPEMLISCVAVTLFVIGAYINLENPTLKNLEQYHGHMVTSYSTLIESRDDSTGSHIKRTTEYVRIILQTMQKKGLHRHEVTRDYFNSMIQAAPLHDIGKIAIPDRILQKPGKLTDEEYELMKTHTERGGEIILNTFARLDDDKYYTQIAYEVATSHHEKWDGTGYPRGLSGEEIPLSARIMSIADVFDAVSANRCYRAAMPIDQCFDIIARGKGIEFDPEIVDLFIDARNEIEQVYLANQDF